MRRCVTRKIWTYLGIGFAIAILVMLAPEKTYAFTIQAYDNTHKICKEATVLQERKQRIPRRLLGAISLAETGRWDKINRVSVAWPWTVTTGGEGYFFDSKAEAVAEVELLLTQGVRNIDVGCMQINLMYHGDAFETIEQAFDPDINAAYAAQVLKQKFAGTKNWITAVGHYHSTTPSKSKYYSAKVTKIWKRQKNLPYLNLPDQNLPGQNTSPVNTLQLASATALKKTRQNTGSFNLFAQSTANAPAFQSVNASAFQTVSIKELELEENFNPQAVSLQPKPSAIIKIDQTRMHDLNVAFKKRRKAQRLSAGVGGTGAQSATARRKSELDQWRNNVSNGLNIASVSAVRVAEIARKKQEKLMKLLKNDNDFSTRRQEQLKQWKKTGLFVGG